MTAWSEVPVIHVGDLILLIDQERGFPREEPEVPRYPIHVGDLTALVREQGEWQATKFLLESSVVLHRIFGDSDDLTSCGTEEVVLLTEVEATTLAVGGPVPCVEEQKAALAVEGRGFHKFTFIVEQREFGGFQSNEILRHDSHLRLRDAVSIQYEFAHSFSPCVTRPRCRACAPSFGPSWPNSPDCARMCQRCVGRAPRHRCQHRSSLDA